MEKLQEEKAFVDNWPPERNYLFFLAKYTLINYEATVNIHYSENEELTSVHSSFVTPKAAIIDVELQQIPF